MANAVYQKMDQLYQGKMYFPGKGAGAARARTPRQLPSTQRRRLTSLLPTPTGYFPNELRAIFREQVHLIQNAIIESEQRKGLGSSAGVFQKSLRSQGPRPGGGRGWRDRTGASGSVQPAPNREKEGQLPEAGALPSCGHQQAAWINPSPPPACPWRSG